MWLQTCTNPVVLYRNPHWFWLERSGLATHARSQARSEQEYQQTHTGFKRTTASLYHAVYSELTAFASFMCPYPQCGRGFSVQSNMRRHYNTHLSHSEDRWETSPSPESPD
jgi:hypothetical protein